MNQEKQQLKFERNPRFTYRDDFGMDGRPADDGHCQAEP